MNGIGNHPLLVVEDNPIDYEAITWSLNRVGVTNSVYHCEDGDNALDFLFHRGEFTDPTTSPQPGLMLLDLNMPGTDGREVLTEIKSDEQLRVIPVIIYTTSNDPKDVNSCYHAGANCYMQKPVGLDQCEELAKRLKSFWLELATIPEPEK